MSKPKITTAVFALFSFFAILHSGFGQSDYSNEFTSEGFNTYNVLDGWNFDYANGKLDLSIGGGTRNRFATVQLDDWVGPDFVASSWFSVKHVEGLGSGPSSVGLVALSDTAIPSNYYLAYWAIGGGGAGVNGELILLRNGAGSFSVTGGLVGLPEVDQVYEFRLTGVYGGNGLTLTARVYNRDGAPIGPATEVVDPAPLTGPHFGIRNRTGHATQFLELEHYSFSVSHEVLPPPTLPAPVLIEFVDLSPAPEASYHQASAGLRFTVTSGEDRTILPADIELYLNDELVSPGDLQITGVSPSLEVFYGGLEENRFYNARVVARDNENGREMTWSFDTLVNAEPISAITDVPLNQTANDAIQGMIGASSLFGVSPENGTTARLTDGSSAAVPDANVILSWDEPVSVTWDLAGTPAVGAHRTVERIDIWLSGDDPRRTGFDGEFQISNDGATFTTIPNSRFQTALPYTGATVEISSVTVEGSGTENPNLVRYQFDPTDFPEEGVRFLRFVSYGYNNLGEADSNFIRQPRIVEIDVFTEENGPYIAAIAPADGSAFVNAANGIHFAVTADPEKQVESGDIQFFLNDELVESSALSITGDPTSWEVSYAGLQPNEFYTARVVAGDELHETGYEWSFDTREPINGDYVNNFTEEGLPYITAESGIWRIDRESGVLNYLQLPGAMASVGTASIELTGWNGVDVSLSTRFTLNQIAGTGAPMTLGFGAFGGSSTFSAGLGGYYLADLDPSGSQGLRLLSQPSREESFSSSSGNPGALVIGQTYEMRLTGRFEAGVLEMTLVLLDEDGNQLGTAATATDTQPLTGRFFGFRNRTSGVNHTMNVDFHHFSVTPPPPTVASLSPESGATFHSAADGLTFSVTAAEGEEISAENIRLFLNGVEITSADLVITGTSPVLQVTYQGLAPNTFYNARVLASGEAGVEESRVWTFDTFEEETTLSIEAEDYNFAPDVDCDAWGNPVGTYSAGGAFINDPTPSTFYSPWQTLINRDLDGTPIGYVDRVGVSGIDYNETTLTSGVVGVNMYRFCDPVGTVESNDYRRGKYTRASEEALVEIPDYHVTGLQTGEWYNYTRVYPEGEYHVYLRAAVTGNPAIRVDRVSSDASAGNQVTEVMGEFEMSQVIPGDFSYFPLVESGGEKMVVSLQGAETLRLVAVNADNNIDLNFLLFVPAVEPSELPALTITREEDQLLLKWDGDGVQLETAPEVTGPWSTVEGASSPYIIQPVLNSRQFFRLRRGN